MNERLRQQIMARKIGEHLDSFTLKQLGKQMVTDPDVAGRAPEYVYQLDPRDGTMVIYSTARAGRARTVQQVPPSSTTEMASNCGICGGDLAPVIDVAELSSGLTFITENRYPAVHPRGLIDHQPAQHVNTFDHRGFQRRVYGIHLVQWMHEHHHLDWHNMESADLQIVLARMTAVEAKMLKESGSLQGMADIDYGERCFVNIFKNYGENAGASMSHGHQQLLFSNVMPRSSYLNWMFWRRHGIPFSEFMLRETPRDLLVADYPDIAVLVPYFMKRPYALMAVVKTTKLSHLHRLSDNTLTSLTQAIQTSIKALMRCLQEDGSDTAYNLVYHTGPGCGIYLELFPRAQKIGGLEQLGTWVCEADPQYCAERLRRAIVEDT